MARNENHGLPNRHALFLARTGGGKSQMLKQCGEWPQRGVRSILWDPGHDHAKGTHYYAAPSAFRDALASALRSGRAFRVAYDGTRTVETFEWFCQLVWAALDGGAITYVVVEELARVCPNPGEATPWFGRVLEEGRKYGAVVLGTSQRPQSVTKTAYDNARTLWVGPNNVRAAKMIEERTDVDRARIAALPELTFLRCEEGTDPREVTIRYRK